MQLDELKLRDYQLLRELGRGGMAIVYEAIETSVARPVAIKILPAAAALDERQSSRFRFEAQVAASLDHPRIVPVYTVGSEDQALFYVMKYIDGRSLAAVVEEMRPPSDENLDEAHMLRVAQWGLQAAEALSYAHARGVVHGDVKPANLLLDLSGDLWLTDFGAARLSAPKAHSPELAPAGTTRYLSPEQVRGETWNIDHRIDVYALGATLFELATLRPALSGGNSSELLRQIASGTTPRPAAWNMRIPARLRENIIRAMAADLNTRYATAGELAEDLRRFLKSKPTTTGRLSRIGSSLVPRKRISIAAAGFLAFAAGFASLTYIARRSVAFNLSQPTAANQEANQHLPSITEQDLDQLADKLARGTSLTEAEAQLIQLGPATDDPSLDSDIEYQELARYERAKVYDRLAMIHAWKFEFSEQETMLVRSSEQWAALIEQHPFPAYVAGAALSQLMMCELYANTNRIEESIAMGRQAISQLQTLHQSDPNDVELAVALAYALTRLDLTLTEILPQAETEQHQRSVVEIMESLPELSDVEQFYSGESPVAPNTLRFPDGSWRDAFAECRLNLAMLTADVRKVEPILKSAMQELSTSAVFNQVAGRRLGILAKGNQVYGARLSQISPERRADVESHYRDAAALFRELSNEFPRVVEYRAGLAIALSDISEVQRSSGKVEESILPLTQAIALLDELTTEYPNYAQFHHRLAGASNNLGLSQSDEPTLAGFERAVQHGQIAVSLSPRHRQYRRWLAIQCNNLAAQYLPPKDLTKEEAFWRAAIDNSERLSELGNTNYNDRHNLAHFWLGLCECLSATDGNFHEATDAFRTATAKFYALFEESGHKPHDACMLAATYSQWSQLQEKQGNLDQAKQTMERAIAHEQEALNLEPDQADHDSSLTEYRQRLEKLLQ